MEDTEGPDDSGASGDDGTVPPPPDPVAEALDRLGAALTEVAETVVGLGVLGLNRLQALRRDLAEQAERDRRPDRPAEPEPQPERDREPDGDGE